METLLIKDYMNLYYYDDQNYLVYERFLKEVCPRKDFLINLSGEYSDEEYIKEYISMEEKEDRFSEDGYPRFFYKTLPHLLISQYFMYNLIYIKNNIAVQDICIVEIKSFKRFEGYLKNAINTNKFTKFECRISTMNNEHVTKYYMKEKKENRDKNLVAMKQLKINDNSDILLERF